jgi:hypothetical protein
MAVYCAFVFPVRPPIDELGHKIIPLSLSLGGLAGAQMPFT